MSGINTVSGLRNVSIDYRPQVGPDAANAAGAQQQAADEIPALKAAEQRLDGAIAHAKKLNAKGRVFDEGDWTDERKLSGLTNLKTKLEFVKYDGTTKTVKPGVKGVKDYLETSTPSLYKRDKFDKMFD